MAMNSRGLKFGLILFLTAAMQLDAQQYRQSQRFARILPGFTPDVSAPIPVSFSVRRPARISGAQATAILQTAVDAVANYEIPGITYAVRFFGQPLYEGAAGYADSPGTIPMQPNHLMRIGSASKTFVTMSILRLAREGKCWLDQPVLQILPQLATTMSNYDLSNVTLRMLIQHTSGIANYTENDDWSAEYIFNRTRVWTDNELLELVNNGNTNGAPSYYQQTSTPGEAWHYSNSNYILLGMVVEALTGTNIGTYVTATFIRPLGLTHTYYPLPGYSWPSADGNAGATYAHGYADWANYFGMGFLPGWGDVTQYDPSGVGAAGPMVSTAGDLAYWMQAIVQNRILVGSFDEAVLNWRTFMANPTSTNWNENMCYGLGLAHEPDFNNNANYYVIGHRGQIGGYDAAMMILPDLRCALAVICNRSLKTAAGYPNNALKVALNEMVNVLHPRLIATTQLPQGRPMLPRKGGFGGSVETGPASIRPDQSPLTEYP